ncbi:hypothetical protein A2U01_0097755, partial [Trifolium medium]|nr:hypothetical protein [Trifolium medium]
VKSSGSCRGGGSAALVVHISRAFVVAPPQSEVSSSIS